MQAMQAAKELQRNLAADNAELVYIWRVWCATVTAHQMVCGDLAAWCDIKLQTVHSCLSPYTEANPANEASPIERVAFALL